MRPAAAEKAAFVPDSLRRRPAGRRLARSCVRADPAQTDSAAPPIDGAAPAGQDATFAAATADPGVAPVDPVLQHFRFDCTWLPGENSGNGLEINDVDGSVTLAAPLGQGLAPLLFTPGGGLHFWDRPRSAAAGAVQLPKSLFDSYVEVGWRPRLAEWLFADLAVTPGVYSDFRDVSGRSFQMRGRGLAIVAFSPQLQVALGALYVNYNHTKLLPAGGVIWNPNDDTRLLLLFPQPKLSHRLGAWGDAELWGYLKGEFGGGRWSIERADGSPDSMDYMDARALVGLERVTPGGMSSHMEVGYVFSRRVTFASGAPDVTPDATVLLRVGLAY